MSRREQRSPSLATSHTSLTPCPKADFAAALTPCLALVGGIGFKIEERTEWMHAAYLALDGVPADLVKRGARAAMLKADHPSKIVPLIMGEIADELALRRRLNTNRPMVQHQPEPQTPQELTDEQRQEVAEIMANLARKMGPKT